MIAKSSGGDVKNVVVIGVGGDVQQERPWWPGVKSVVSGDHAQLQPAPGARSGRGAQRTSRGGQLVGVKRLVVAHDEHVHITAAGHEGPERSGAVEICRDQARDHLAERDIETPDELDHRAHGVRPPRCNDISTPAIPYRRLSERVTS